MLLNFRAKNKTEKLNTSLFYFQFRTFSTVFALCNSTLAPVLSTPSMFYKDGIAFVEQCMGTFRGFISSITSQKIYSCYKSLEMYENMTKFS